MAIANSAYITQSLLFTPGPTPIPEYIRQAISQPTLHHRTSEFEDIFAYVRKNLQAVIGMKDVLMLASSGTGAMEACVNTFSSRKILSINSGKFGERFGLIGRALGRDVLEIINEWDTPASIQEVIEVLTQNNDIECVCMQACESAGGLLHPYAEIAKCVKEINEDIIVIVDGITAIGVEKMDITHIDALIGGSQKAFMLPPGLAFIGLSERAINFIENHQKGYYFNLAEELRNQRKNTTAYTSTTSIIIGLKAYFDLLAQNHLSFEDLYGYTAKIAKASRESLQAIGLHIYPKVPANSMSVVDCEYVKDITQILKARYNVHLAGGQDRLQNKIFRINHMGYVPLHEISFVLNAIELALDELNIRDFNSCANSTFFNVLKTNC